MEKIAGLLFFLAGIVILMGILTAEIFYGTTYSVSLNMISNLGSTPPPHSIVREPSAFIFDKSLLIAGILIMVGIYFIQKVSKNMFFTVSLAILGLGTFGVGIFPAFHAVIHPLVALIAFLGGGLASVSSARVTKSPFSFMAILLGITSLSFLGLGVLAPHVIVPIFGAGGTERWVMYPVLLWLTGFGGYLMNAAAPRSS